MIASARAPFSFLVKPGAAVALVALADLLFYDHDLGSTLGGFALAWVLLVVLAVSALRRGGPACSAAIAAIVALVLIDDPNLLAWLLYLIAIASAVLLPRRRFRQAASWAATILGFGVLGLVAPLRDASRLARQGPRGIGTIALPLVGGTVFLALFGIANPVLGAVFTALVPASFGDLMLHILFWCAVVVLVWPSFRPLPPPWGHLTIPDAATATVSVGTLTLSLVTFNAVFAVQNGLDLMFLWSGAPLPAGVTLADYAHRGAYPLIATALLAAGFVLATLRTGSAAAANAGVRRLVMLWVAQNVVLVASCILRTADYVGAYSLTILRLSALAWMALVGVGLILIGWRTVAQRSAAWLVNANALAAAIVLAGASVIDLGSVAAAWNVRHARSARDLDMAYLHALGPSALLSLIELDRRAGPRLHGQIVNVRDDILADLAARQADWHSWTWRGARRLAAARSMLPRPASPRPALPLTRRTLR